MQYGNVLFTQHEIENFAMFKSYYVVWKPFEILFLIFSISSLNRTMQYGNTFHLKMFELPIQKFKSYYVVWKPDVIKTGIIQNFLFKSYYVVWKRGCCNRNKGECCSLNRTMQYGNYCMLLHFQRIIKSLNRTMQYGNSLGF